MPRRARSLLAALLPAALLLVLTAGAAAQEAQRTLLGQVLDEKDKVAASAIVYLKNMTTKEQLTVVTNKEGRYQFNALGMKEDYELYAESGERKSRVRRVSQFDTRERIVINLKLELAASKPPESKPGAGPNEEEKKKD